jgi:hypothetical protein
MRDAPARMDITPELIDMGDRVVQLGQVTSVRVGIVHPWRHAARFPLVAAAVLIAASMVRGGGFTVDGLSVAALTSLALAIVLLVYRVRRLVIATADGERVLIGGHDPAFLRLVLDRIRLAMAAGDPGYRCAVDLVTRTIETGEIQEQDAAALPSLRATHDEIPEPMLPPALNGQSAGQRHDTLEAPVNDFSAPRSVFADHRREALDRGPRLTAPAAPAAPPAPQAGIEAVITLIDRAQLPHKSEIHALLEPVRDHLAGGRTARSDARHNWKLFHDYARKYLTDVDGLTDACDRLDGTMT